VGAIPQPGIVTDGNLSIGNSNVISGECGGIHANGNLSSVGGGPTLATQATATGTVNGSYRLPDGTPAPQVNGAPEVPIPDLNPMTFCAGAEFNLIVIGIVGYVQNAAGVNTIAPTNGWSYDNATQTWTGNGTPTTIAPGTYCSQQNIWLQGSVGSAAAPKSISLLSSKSIRVEGTPYIKADQDDGILIMAAGDVYLAGNPAVGALSYQGMVYGGAQCTATGNATAIGQILCANGAQPAGAIDWSPVNAVSGNFNLTFDCSGNVFNKRRVLFWYPRIGT